MPAHQDIQALHDLLRRLTDAWNAGDAAAYGELFTHDADYITFFGLHLQGRQAIEDSHRKLFEGPLKGSRLTGGSAAAPADGGQGADAARVRLLRPDVAVIVTTGGSTLAGQQRPAPERDSIITLTAVNDGGGWRFASFQNTRRQPLPTPTGAGASAGPGAGR